MSNHTTVKFKLLGIDAWREPEGGWTWNQMFIIADEVLVEKDLLTPRKVLRFLREAGYLYDASKGRLRVDMNPGMIDGYLIEIQDRRNGEPLLALSTIH